MLESVDVRFMQYRMGSSVVPLRAERHDLACPYDPHHQPSPERWPVQAANQATNRNGGFSAISRRIGMVLHLSIAEPGIETPEILMPAITDWVADTTEQTITHVATGCRFHAYPVPTEGVVVPFARRQIAVRFVGMADRKPMPPPEEINRLGTQGILWIVSYTMESPRPLRA
jgi:hypothetical protein